MAKKEIKEKKVWLSVAVIHKQRNNLLTVQRAVKVDDLYRKYPAEEYRLVDISNNEVPHKQGAASMGPDSQLTMDQDDNWKWKVTQEEIDQKVKDRLVFQLRFKMVNLEVLKDKATTMGADYATILADIDAKIATTQAQLDELVGP